MDTVSPRPSRPVLDVGAIFDEQFDYVFGALRRLGVRESDLEDLVHEVFLKVHVRREDYDPTRPLRPWLFGFAYRVAADYRRLARHRVEVPGQPETADPSRPADQYVEEAQERAIVSAALESVEVERRAIFLLHEVEGVAIPEVADALGLRRNTAYSRLRLARAEFAAAIKRLRAAKGKP